MFRCLSYDILSSPLNSLKEIKKKDRIKRKQENFVRKINEVGISN